MKTFSRFAGLMADLTNGHALCAGASGGSDLEVKLAKHGCGTVSLVDPDTVDPPNLPRTYYRKGDLGKFKVDALKAHILEAAPGTTVHAHVAKVQDVLTDAYCTGPNRPDLLLGLTDSLPGQAHVSTMAVKHGIPAVLVDVHAHAAGGMVTVVVPGSPCYRCVAANRFEAAERGDAQVDLDGAHGLGADIAFIDAIALKIALALLSKGTDTDAGRFLQKMGKRTQVVVRMHPEYRWDAVDLFDLVLADLPTAPRDFKRELQDSAYFACDTLWLTPDFDPQCPCCAQAGA